MRTARSSPIGGRPLTETHLQTDTPLNRDPPDRDPPRMNMGPGSQTGSDIRLRAPLPPCTEWQVRVTPTKYQITTSANQ